VLTAPKTAPTIKGNIIIGVADLFLRFPNAVEPYSEYIYHGLKKHAPNNNNNNNKNKDATKNDNRHATNNDDASTASAAATDELYVRKTTLLMLTHLILNDMVKAKAPLAEIAKCTQDFTHNPRLAELSRRFFEDLNSKSGDGKATIYNMLPDILSRLSGESAAAEVGIGGDRTVDALTTEGFKEVFKFLLAFLTKDKQIDNLVDKLLRRFENMQVDTAPPSILLASQPEQPPVVVTEKKEGEDGDGEGDAMSVTTAATENDEAAAEADETSSVATTISEDASSHSVPAGSSSTPSTVSTGGITDPSAISAAMHLKQCRDLSYCLTQLPFSVASVKRLQTLWRCYANALGDHVVHEHFQSILARVRKQATQAKEKEGGSKADRAAAAAAADGTGVASSAPAVTSTTSLIREKDVGEVMGLLDELETKMSEAHNKLLEDARTSHKAQRARGKKGYGEHTREEQEEEDDEDEAELHSVASSSSSSSRRRGAATTSSRNKKLAPAKGKAKVTKANSRRRRVQESSDDEENESSEEDEDDSVDEISEEEEDDEEEEAPAPKRGKKAAPPAKKAAPAKGRRRRVVDSDDDEEEE